MTEAGREVVVLPVAEDVARRAAEEFAAAARDATGADGIFTVALSGGSTPVAMFKLLAEEPYRSRIPWDRTHLFWSDERCVPPDHPDSNYGAAARALLAPLGLEGSDTVHRMPG